MADPVLVNCSICGRQYNPQKLRSCPVCAAAGPAPSQIASNPSATVSVPPVSTPRVASTNHYGRIAASSAEVVNAYGTWIQIAGGILGLLTFLGVWYTFNQQYEGVKGFFIGLFSGILIFLSNLVIGALYRMISNYVLFKVRG